LLVATRKGMCIRFNENDARSIGRTARGVRAIQLSENDEVVGMAVLCGQGTILTVSETGYGRRSEQGDFRVQSRGGKGVINYRVGEYGDVAAVRLVQDDEEIILISSDGIIIRVPANEISVFSRPAKGVRVMRLDEGQKLVTLTTTAASIDEEEEGGEEHHEDGGRIEKHRRQGVRAGFPDGDHITGLEQNDAGQTCAEEDPYVSEPDAEGFRISDEEI